MNSKVPMSSEVLISFNNLLSTAEKEKEKKLRRFLDTSNNIIHKMNMQLYVDLVSLVELNTTKWHVY